MNGLPPTLFPDRPRTLAHHRLPPIGFLEEGKISILIDGQFGSTGKGAVASFLGAAEPPDLAITTASPNAGHTFYDEYGVRRVAHHLPVTACLDAEARTHALKLLCAGSIVDPSVLLSECEALGVDPESVQVHPRAAVIEPDDIEAENAPGSSAERISSTRKGVGAALARKIRREATLAGDHAAFEALGPFQCFWPELPRMLDTEGFRGILEVPQGFGLGINSGLAYPYTTSRDITVAQALADLQLHPAYLGKVAMTVRTFPIRVGDIPAEGAGSGGTSGPFPEDSKELSWEALGLPAELTTVTRRVRRVATFSMSLYEAAVRAFRPDFVILTFCDQLLDEEELAALIGRMAHVKAPTHLTFGPYAWDLVPAAIGAEAMRRLRRFFPAPVRPRVYGSEAP